ncbi:MAG: hypothetical protein U1E17_04250 [Geminicoccaceae bacterium]
MLAYFAVFAPGFLGSYNLANIVEQSAVLGILAFGMTVVVIGGGGQRGDGRDRPSLAANLGLSAAVYAVALDAAAPTPWPSA